MNENRFVIVGLLGGMGLGLAALAFPSAIGTVRDFTEGMLGIEPTPSQGRVIASEVRAERAAPTLNRELDIDELKELFQGTMYTLNGRYAEAVPILGKYAMLGDTGAQYTIGTMFYFGRGFPVDREEAIRWFRLAAAQGGPPERETLAAAINGSLQWESSQAEQQFGYAGPQPASTRYNPGNPARSHSYDSSGYGVGGKYEPGGTASESAPMGARRSIEEAYGSGPASRGYAGGQVAVPQVDNASPVIVNGASPVILNRAGPGTYSDDRGDIYTQAGPHGVVNTRTGEFNPTN